MGYAQTTASQRIAYGPSFLGLLYAGYERFQAWCRRQADAERLHNMTDYQLRDIGITRADIPSVINGSFFR
jgi:uncharacterized protein YjiS (DUF1127 family)